MMREGPVVAVGGVILTLLLLNSKRFPAMLCLLAYGIAVAFFKNRICWATSPMSLFASVS